MSPNPEACPPGTFNPQAGGGESAVCQACSLGSWCGRASSIPQACPAPLTTQRTGATSSLDCVCPFSFVGVVTNSSLLSCVDCPQGADCSLANTTLATLRLANGYWRPSISSLAVVKCPQSKFCVGSSENASVRHGYQAFGMLHDTTYCAVGHRGPFCDVCDVNYFRVRRGICQACGEASYSLTVGVFLLGGLLVLCVAATFGRRITRRCDRLRALSPWFSSRKASDHDATAAWWLVDALEDCLAKFEVKIRILISFYQVLKRLGFVFQIPYPPLYTAFLEWTSLFTLEFLFDIDILPLGCIMSSNYHTSLLFYTLAPLALYSTLGLVPMLAQCFRAGKEALRSYKRVCQSLSMLILFLIYPSVSSTVFEAFLCESLSDGRSVHQIDRSIDCRSPSHRAFMVYAAAMVLIHPLGTPLVYAYLLRTHRTSLSRLRLLEAKALLSAEQEDVQRQLLQVPSTTAATGTEKSADPKVRRQSVEVAQAHLRHLRERSRTRRPASDEEGAEPIVRRRSVEVAQAHIHQLREKSRMQRVVRTSNGDGRTSRRSTGDDDRAFMASALLPPYVHRLIKPYRLQRYNFEIFECARKVALIGIPVFLFAGQLEQLTFGLLVSFVSAMIFVAHSPYEEHSDNAVAVGAQASLFASLLLGILLKADAQYTGAMEVMLCALGIFPLACTLLLEAPVGGGIAVASGCLKHVGLLRSATAQQSSCPHVPETHALSGAPQRPQQLRIPTDDFVLASERRTGRRSHLEDHDFAHDTCGLDFSARSTPGRTTSNRSCHPRVAHDTLRPRDEQHAAPTTLHAQCRRSCLETTMVEDHVVTNQANRQALAPFRRRKQQPKPVDSGDQAPRGQAHNNEAQSGSSHAYEDISC